MFVRDSFEKHLHILCGMIDVEFQTGLAVGSKHTQKSLKMRREEWKLKQNNAVH